MDMHISNAWGVSEPMGEKFQPKDWGDYDPCATVYAEVEKVIQILRVAPLILESGGERSHHGHGAAFRL